MRSNDMNFSSKVLIGLLMCIALALFWYSNNDDEIIVDAKGEPYAKPDTVLVNPRIQFTNVDGKLTYDVQASSAYLSGRDGSLSLKGIEVQYFQPDDYGADAVGWKLRADRGKMSAARDTLDLDGDIVAIGGAQPPATVKMDAVTIEPEEERAISRSAVEITQNNTRITAQQIEILFSRSFIRMIGNVRGYHEL